MGLCLEGKGKMSVEVRRESFIVHAGYWYTKDADGDEVHTPDSDRFGRHWREAPRPEFVIADLDDLIAALQEAKSYLVRDGRMPAERSSSEVEHLVAIADQLAQVRAERDVAWALVRDMVEWTKYAPLPEVTAKEVLAKCK